MPPETMPKPESSGDKSGRIRFKVGDIEYSMTPEEYEAHIKVEAKRKEREEQEREKGTIGNLIDTLRKSLEKEKQEPEEKREAD